MPQRLFAALLLVSLWVLGCPRPLRADTPRNVELAGPLVWGGDQEGGGPYVYPADDDPGRMVGFEVELAAGIAAQWGATSSFFQGQWDKMPELLRSHKCDVVLNGYEWTAPRLAIMDASIPYYVYELQLLARADGDIHAWSDLEKTPPAEKRRVGVLGGSAAEQYLTSQWGERINVVSYDGSTDAMREVETKKLDATLQDTPVASFYKSRFPALGEVGPPVGRGYYVIYARKGDTSRIRALNEALVTMTKSGELEAIYRKYGIWNDAQRELANIALAGRFYGVRDDASRSSPVASSGGIQLVSLPPAPHGLAVVREYGLILLQSAGLTVLLSCLSFPLAMALGLWVALGRLYGPSWLKAPLATYVEFLRGTPVMLQLYFIFFFLPEIGIVVPAFWTAVLGLGVNYSAYESEIYRAGILAVPRGQMEAALALGMSRGVALRRIIVPQAVRVVLPPMVNDFIALFKDTSVCSVVTLVELTKRFSVLSQSSQATAELMVLTAILYLAMSYPLSIAARRIELRLERVPA